MYIFGHFTPTDPAIDFGLRVHPVCLPIASSSNPNEWRNQDVDILGFSTKDKGESINRGDKLKAARMKVFNQTMCNDRLDIEKNKVEKCIAEEGETNCDHVELLTQAKSAIPEGYTRNVFCAYNSVGEEATCKGDSGGPVIAVDSEQERHVLIGTIHGAFSNCKKYLPGIFVEVDDYSVLEFLQAKVFGSACDFRGTANATKTNLDDETCKCKNFVKGEFCNECKEGYWNLTQINPDGCQSK